MSGQHVRITLEGVADGVPDGQVLRVRMGGNAGPLVLISKAWPGVAVEDVVATLPGGYEVERLWHDRFGHLRVAAADCGGTEWFRGEPELMGAIRAAVAAVVGSDQ